MILTDLGEAATRELVKENNPFGLEDNKKVAIAGGEVAKVARDNLEVKLGKSVSKNNFLNYSYDDKDLININKEN